KTPVYLDYNATTPLDPRVLDAMMPYFTDRFGNAASRHHALGCDAAQAVERARAQVADLIGADPREIVFTSGATESDNLALKGVAESPVHHKRGRHIVTAATEHKAVIDTCRHLETRGFEVTYLPVDADGRIDLQQLDDAVTDRTILVSLMHANNETGVLHPIRDIGALCRRHGVLFHTDATQSVGKEPLHVEDDQIDLLSLSAHKMYGPKGVGALYVRRRRPRVRCEPLIHGGGHERGLRSGTLNVPAIIGLGAAATIYREDAFAESQRIRRLRDHLQAGLTGRIDGVTLNGDRARRLAGTLNLSFSDVHGEALMRAVPEIAVSSSSACTSAALQPSYVLGAMGRSDELIAASIRFSLGRFTTREEIDFTIDRVIAAVTRIRATAPARSEQP
ncbi:MAG: IscS subfamily cysteine desulfurase, partial [Phycisphaerae bacterium]